MRLVPVRYREARSWVGTGPCVMVEVYGYRVECCEHTAFRLHAHSGAWVVTEIRSGHRVMTDFRCVEAAAAFCIAIESDQEMVDTFKRNKPGESAKAPDAALSRARGIIAMMSRYDERRALGSAAGRE